MLEDFIQEFGGLTEKYTFYNGEVELRYDKENHEYLLAKDGQLIPQPGVTTVCHIIDKSNALIPWACKMMAEKLLKTAPVNDANIIQISQNDFVTLVNAAKSAHKEKMEDAADVGHIAHNWLESYINSVLNNDDMKRMEILANFPDEERAKNCCIAALSWMQKHNVRWISTEKKIYSRKYGYAGTLDGKAIVDSCDNPLCCPHEFKDRLSLIDWKSSNYLYIEYLYQTAAYEQAEEEQYGEDIRDRWIIRLGKTDGEFEPWHVEHDQFEEDWNGFRLALELYNNVNSVSDRMNVRRKFIKEEQKKVKQAAKEAALKIKCKSADKYKGIRPPTCNGGNPCQTCLEIYKKKQEEKQNNS